jgi:hypothetical protein
MLAHHGDRQETNAAHEDGLYGKMLKKKYRFL